MKNLSLQGIAATFVMCTGAVVLVAACSSSEPGADGADASTGKDGSTTTTDAGKADAPVTIDAATTDATTDAGSDAAISCGALTACEKAGTTSCVNTTNDNANCGSCGNACTAGSCVASVCTPTCIAPETLCALKCVNKSTDKNNCSTCGHVCSFTQGVAACNAGACAMTGCNVDFADCNANSGDGCEVNTKTDAKNCGACGNACSLGESCNAGACTTVYTTGLLNYWSMDEKADATEATDKSGNAISAVISPGSTTVFVPGAGKQGSGAVQFDGSGWLGAGYATNAADNAGIYIPQGDITFSMWIKTAAAVQGLSVVNGSDVDFGSCDRVIGSGGGNSLSYNAWSEVNMSGAKVVNDDAWHHVVYVLDKAKGFSAYVDGVLDVELVDAANNATGNCGVGCSGFNWAKYFRIGTAGGCRYGAGNFTGLMDDVRIYTKPLSAADVLGLYNVTK